MRMIEVLTIASLLLLPGAIAPAYAEEKQPEQKQQQAKPRKRSDYVGWDDEKADRL